MIRIKNKDLPLIISAAVIGYFCMTHSAFLPITALIIPVLWILADTRVSAFFIILSYHLAISRGVIPGAPVFLSETHTLADAFVLWAAMATGVSLPFMICWSRERYKKIPCLSCAFLFAYFLPPLALIGVVNPLMMSGCLFPGWGWFGLFSVLIIYVLCVMNRKIAYLFIAIILVLPMLRIGELKMPQNPSGFLAVDTSFGRLGSGSFDFTNDYERIQMVFGILRKSDIQSAEQKYIVLPETIAGRLNKPGLDLWTTELKKIIRDDQVVIFGGELPTDNGKKYDNVMIFYDTKKIKMKAQRIPVPYSMYRGPFAERGANLHLFDDGILVLSDGRKATVIMCYEAFLCLPYLLSFMQNTDLILWAGNQWWCKDTSLPIIQERCVALWAQLFNTPAILVRNN